MDMRRKAALQKLLNYCVDDERKNFLEERGIEEYSPAINETHIYHAIVTLQNRLDEEYDRSEDAKNKRYP